MGRALVRSSVMQVWPGTAVGEPLSIDIGTEEEGALRVRVVHLGTALSPDALEGLGRSLGATLDREVQLIDVAIPSAPLTRAAGDMKFVSDVTAGVRASADIRMVNVCVVEPAPAPTKNMQRADRRDQELAAAVRSVLATHSRVTTATGGAWAVQFAGAACPESAPSALQ